MDDRDFEAMNRDESPTKKTIYVVSYWIGPDYDHQRRDIFTTFDREKAESYVEKFNRILGKAKDFFQVLSSEFRYDSSRFPSWDIYSKYSEIDDIICACIYEIEFRK